MVVLDLHLAELLVGFDLDLLQLDFLSLDRCGLVALLLRHLFCGLEELRAVAVADHREDLTPKNFLVNAGNQGRAEPGESGKRLRQRLYLLLGVQVAEPYRHIDLDLFQ